MKDLHALSRRAIYDYAGDRVTARYVELHFRPGTRVPRHRTAGLTDWFVLTGGVEVDGRPAEAASYVTIEPETDMAIESRYGARVLCWADAPVTWSDGAEGIFDLYGF